MIVAPAVRAAAISGAASFASASHRFADDLHQWSSHMSQMMNAHLAGSIAFAASFDRTSDLVSIFTILPIGRPGTGASLEVTSTRPRVRTGTVFGAGGSAATASGRAAARNSRVRDMGMGPGRE